MFAYFQIKLRKLDVFFELEEKIMSRATLDRSLMQVRENLFKLNLPFYKILRALYVETNV